MKFSGVKYVLMDIEGTISDISFVKDVMFPYSAEAIPGFLREKVSEGVQDVAAVAEDVVATMKDENEDRDYSLDEVIDQLLVWIKEDRKHPALKAVQGMVWKQGFEQGVFRAPLYADVPPAWQRWIDQGLTLGIYSSGSVAAQKLFFKYTENGDVLGGLSHHFDLKIGSKKESSSYQKIQSILAVDLDEILFLSDVEGELSAAAAAGLQVCQALRPGIEASAKFPGVKSFDELEIA